MNVKYNQLSIIGKVWTIAEMFNMGLYEKRSANIKATFRKLAELSSNPNVLNYGSMKDSSLENIIINAFAYKQKIMDNMDVSLDFVDDGSIVSAVWFNRQLFDYVKFQLRNNEASSEDVRILKDVYYSIRRIYVNELKNKQLCSKERVELHKIFKEIENVKLNVETKCQRGQLELK